MSGGNHSDLVNIAEHMPFLEAAASRASFVLELGVGAGNGSTRAFSRGLRGRPDALMISVDIDPKAPQYGGPTDAFWHLIHASTTDPKTLAKVKAVAGERQPDILFIDTEHTYEQMRAELELWGRFAKDSTLWLFHDTWMEGEYNHMTDAIKEYALAEGWRYEDVSVECNGLGKMSRPWVHKCA